MSGLDEHSSLSNRMGAPWQKMEQDADDHKFVTLFLQHRINFYQQFVHFYERLLALPRKWRRAIKKRLGMGLATIALLLALGGLGSPVPPVYAATIIVDGTICTLADAINAANLAGGGTVGGCTADAGLDTLDLQVNVSLTTALPAITSPIILNGNSHTIERTGGPDFSVLTVTTAGDLTLNEAVISGGHADDKGGGILNYGSLAINNSTISGSYAYFNGGGIYSSGTVTITQSVITGNFAYYDARGGGIANNGTITINNSTLSENNAPTGGGIANLSVGTGTINNSSLNNNYSEFGGGAYNRGTLIINNSTISGNFTNSTGNGAGIVNLFGILELNNSTIYDNDSSFGGAINNNGTASIYNSTISGNTAYFGGGIYNVNDLTINNSTITGNFAYIGGAIHNLATVTLNRSLLSGNNYTEIDNYGTVNANNYNIVGYGGSARSNGFVPGATDIVPPGPLNTVLDTVLADNGGPTATHALVPGSVAIDVVPTTDPNCTPGSTADQRGAARANGFGAGGPACDAGAFEYASSLSPTAVTLQAFSTTQRGAGRGSLLVTLFGSAAAMGWFSLRYLKRSLRPAK